MKLKKIIQHTLILLPLFSLNSLAQEAAQNILKKGNTWHYDVTLTVPTGTSFKPEFATKGITTAQGTIYKFKERQQSVGEHMIKELEEKMPKVNIYIDNHLRKQQLLKMSNGSLFYYGTYQVDPKDTTKKIGFMTKSPIPLYNHEAPVAEKWQWKHEKIPLFQFRVISKGAEVTVKAGKFKADKIRMEQVDNAGKILVSKEIWFVKDIGVIKESEKQYIPDGKAILKTLELTKFTNEPVK